MSVTWRGKLFGVVLSTVGAVACDAGSRDDPGELLKAAEVTYSNALSSGDLEQVAALYGNDAVQLRTAEQLIIGKAAIRHKWQQVIGIPGFMMKAETANIELSESGEMGFSRGTYLLRMLHEDNSIVLEPGKRLAIWKKDGVGNWRIAAESYSPDIRPPNHKVATNSPSAALALPPTRPTAPHPATKGASNKPPARHQH